MLLTPGNSALGHNIGWKARERLSILGNNSSETSWRGCFVVVYTKEALQFEVGSALGEPLQCNPPLPPPHSSKYPQKPLIQSHCWTPSLGVSLSR